MKKLISLILAGCILFGFAATAQAVGTCAIFRSWNTGDQLTASDQTSSFITVGQTNMIPACMDGDSGTIPTMQGIVDPFPGGAESLATTLKGELERMRFVLKGITGWPQWYSHNGVPFTVSRSALSQTATWNNGAVTFPGAWLLNMTDTASGATSLLLDLQVGGISKFKVDKTGVVTLGNGATIGGAGGNTFASINVTNNTNMVNLGTTNVGTFTLAGGALTAARTWTLPDITGIVMLTNGGQTVTSGVWNGSIVGTAFGGTGLNTSATPADSILFTNGAGTWAAATAGATGTSLRMINATTVQWDHTEALMAQVFN